MSGHYSKHHTHTVRFSERISWLFAGQVVCRGDSVQAVSTDFAARLNHLFDTIVGADGKPYSNEAVISGIAAKGGPTISKGYLSELRSGKKDNPTLKHIEALAGFFEVDPAYFVGSDDSATKISDDVQIAAAMSDAGVKSIALRTARLSAVERELIATLVEQVGNLHADKES